MIPELLFFLSDRSDHMETGLNLHMYHNNLPSTLPPQLLPVRLINISNALSQAPITPSLLFQTLDNYSHTPKSSYYVQALISLNKLLNITANSLSSLPCGMLCILHSSSTNPFFTHGEFFALSGIT